MRIYMDFAAATPVSKSVLKVMEPFWRDSFANPLSHHRDGKSVHKSIYDAHESVAKTLNVFPREIVFTSGATESNTLALYGLLNSLQKKSIDSGQIQKKNIVITNIEHASMDGVYSLCDRLGIEVREARVNHEGLVDIPLLCELVDTDTYVVSCVYVNSEIGTIQPIKDIAQVLREFRKKTGHIVYLHTDATQAPLWLRIDITELGVDLASFDSGKICGPKGVGILVVRHGVLIEPLFLSSSSQNVIRPGTPPAPLIVGCAEALRQAQDGVVERAERIGELRDYFMLRLESLPRIKIRGSRVHRIANNVSISIDGGNHEFARILLDDRGISISTGSACLSGSEDVKSVRALGGGESSALRLTFGPDTSKEEVDIVFETIEDFLKKGLV